MLFPGCTGNQGYKRTVVRERYPDDVNFSEQKEVGNDLEGYCCDHVSDNISRNPHWGNWKLHS